MELMRRRYGRCWRDKSLVNAIWLVSPSTRTKGRCTITPRLHQNEIKGQCTLFETSLIVWSPANPCAASGLDYLETISSCSNIAFARLQQPHKLPLSSFLFKLNLGSSWHCICSWPVLWMTCFACPTWSTGQNSAGVLKCMQHLIKVLYSCFFSRSYLYPPHLLWLQHSFSTPKAKPCA